MTWIKVCGLTTDSAVEAAVTAGVDAVGFVTHPRSPRALPLGRIAQLADGVPVMRVLLVVDWSVGETLDAVAEIDVDAVQPYGAESDAITRAVLSSGLTVLRPLRAEAGLILPQDGSIPLVDTPDTALEGGTGRTFDWDLVADLDGDFVLAGGLGPHNVAEAIRRVAPWGVDASSALEREPGVKDLGKVTAFVEEAKAR